MSPGPDYCPIHSILLGQYGNCRACDAERRLKKTKGEKDKMTHTHTTTFTETITCTRRIQFCAGHRVHGHEGKCQNMHGHNYVALFTAEAALDRIGRVIDFSVLKEKLGGWINEHWDHGFIYWEKDDTMTDIFTTYTHHQKHFELPTNPTAENMAAYLINVVCPAQLAGTGVEVVEVRLWETENCYATARRSDD